MSLLLESAKVWHSLTNVKYIFTVGRRNKTYTIDLMFYPSDFPHVAGMQYASDVDFGINQDEYYGEKLIPVLLDGTLDGRLIENSRNWDCLIKSRLNTIISIESILESKFYITEFDKYRVKPPSKIEAKYVIKSATSDNMFFIFFDEEEHRYYCKSAFQNPTKDYTFNQTKMTLLETKKVEGSSERIIFTNPSFKVPEMQ